MYATPGLDTPDNAALARLLDQHHRALSTAPLAAHLSAVPPQWLHATVRKLSLDPATVSLLDRQDYTHALDAALTALPPFRVRCTPTTNTWSTLLHIDDPDHGFERVDEALVKATRASWGETALHHPANAPHLTTGYCTDPTDTAPYEHATRSTPVEWTVDTLVLAEVLQDPVHHQYRWDTLATFPLNAQTAPSPRP